MGNRKQPFGYRVVMGEITLHPQEAKLVEHIFRQYLAGATYVLNMALFGMTAKQWRDSHPDLKGNIRDYANVSQLVCLSNLENLNAVFIGEGMSQAERLAKLNAIAISQMEILTQDHRIEALASHTGELSPQD